MHHRIGIIKNKGGWYYRTVTNGWKYRVAFTRIAVNGILKITDQPIQTLKSVFVVTSLQVYWGRRFYQNHSYVQLLNGNMVLKGDMLL